MCFDFVFHFKKGVDFINTPDNLTGCIRRADADLLDMIHEEQASMGGIFVLEDDPLRMLPSEERERIHKTVFDFYKDELIDYTHYIGNGWINISE